MNQDLLAAISKSEKSNALALFDSALSSGKSAWDVHNSLFPVVQRVLNPPFINPHLPKMFAIYRDLIAYLEEDDLPALVRLEVNEYARKPKLDELPKPKSFPSVVSFANIEESIAKNDRLVTAARMSTFLKKEGPEEFTKMMLLLGSGYLNNSLGHSVSCTAFILMEMIERKDQNSWPVLSLLADYFCKGAFQKTPRLKAGALAAYDEAFIEEVSRAVSGTGVVALHHTITLYAIERTRHFFNNQEYEHMLNMWAAFLGDKKEKPLLTEMPFVEPPATYGDFFKIFSRLETIPVVKSAVAFADSEHGRRKSGRFLTKAVCQLYQGSYDPHFLNGLGSALWVTERFRNQPSIVARAIYQYVDYFFSGIK